MSVDRTSHSALRTPGGPGRGLIHSGHGHGLSGAQRDSPTTWGRGFQCASLQALKLVGDFLSVNVSQKTNGSRLKYSREDYQILASGGDQTVSIH